MKNCWNLEKIYANDQQVEQAFDHINLLRKKIQELKEDPLSQLKLLLDTLMELQQTVETLYVYSHMKRDEDSRVTKYQKLALKVESIASEVEADASFLEPILMSLPEEKIQSLLEDENLSLYHKKIKRLLRYRPHILGANEEYILSSMSEVTNAPENAFYVLSYADMDFPVLENSPKKEKLNQSNFVPILTSGDLPLRKEAFEKYYTVYEKHQHTLASTLFSNIKALTIEAKLRHYPGARAMELFDDKISENVYDALIESVHAHLPALHHYFGLKKRMLDMDEFHMYDIYMPALKDFSKEIPYEEGKRLVYEAVAPLGEEYQGLIKRAFDEDWIDVYPRDGKKSGAYSWGTYETDPYVLMNYTNDLDSVFTLAHELGHSMHSYYSRQNNPYIYSGYTLFVAEVASTFNELLLLDYLLTHAKDPKEKIYLINHYLDSYKGTVFRQTQFAEFEKLTHSRVENKEALTAEDFSAMYYDLNKKYYGNEVISDDLIRLEWARIPHFYTNFYVYKYATGFSAASALSQRVLSGEEGALEDYRTFLKDGGQNFPLDQLKKAGADMENPETVNIALEKFEDLVQELESLL